MRERIEIITENSEICICCKPLLATESKFFFILQKPRKTRNKSKGDEESVSVN